VELSAAGFTPEVAKYFGARYFKVEHEKKMNKKSAARQVKEPAAAAAAAASADKKKRKPQFSPATEEMDVLANRRYSTAAT
jgi:hypothetical protein